MFISDEQAHKLLNPLYNVAEKDQNDVIANAASALAVRIETKKSRYLLTTLEQRIIQYALKNQPIMPEANQNRRKTYKRRVSLA